jgi:NADH dehydrogenase FAD-containing subunit
VYCTTVSSEALGSNPSNFKIAYDKLVIASGSEPLTFNIKGVKENATFLREVSHAQEIRRKLLTNLMLSENPGNDDITSHMHPIYQGKCIASLVGFAHPYGFGGDDTKRCF